MSYARKRIGMVVAVALLAVVPAVPAEAADKRTQVFKPARTSTKAVTFKLRGVKAQHVLRAALVRRGKVRRRLSPAAARTAARRGVLRVRVRSVHPRRMGRILLGSVAIRRKRNGLWVRRVARTSVKLRVVSDTRAPQTSITSSPDEATESTSATFRFRADERGASFECRVDDGDWRSCSSPTDFTEVPEGDHSFSVRARDRSGNVDETPATREWTVVAPGALEEIADPAADEDVTEATGEVAPAAATGDAVFEDSFTGSNGVITNHYAFWSPDDKTAFRSANWEMESGCALRQDNTLWSGVPTSGEPNKDCSNGSGSEVFRLWTKRTDFGNVAVSMRLKNNGYAVGSQGERSWDGVKIWLRRQGASGSHGLYTVEVNRRQGNIMIQKKCANSDTYHILEQARPEGAAASVGSWEDVGGSVQNQSDGTVKLTMVRHGQTVLEAFDEGVGCAPITSAGRVGVRGDSTNFNVDDFRVVPAV